MSALIWKQLLSLYKSILNIFYNNIIIVHEQRMLYTSRCLSLINQRNDKIFILLDKNNKILNI